MAHVVTENCDGCRFTECITVCPVECFHADATRLYIDPVVCIDCGACVPKCPVKAICDSVDLEAHRTAWIEANHDRSEALPVIRVKGEPLPGAKARQAELGY